ARPRRAKATSSIRRASAGTASTTPRTRMSCWCGAGWVPARSRLPATGELRTLIDISTPGLARFSGGTINFWEDARVGRGIGAERWGGGGRGAEVGVGHKGVNAGDAPLGWKVGFAAPAMLQRLDITGPLVGFLTRNARVQSGGSVSLAGWVKPVAEPEIAVHI